MHKRFIILIPSELGDGYVSTRDLDTITRAVYDSPHDSPMLIDTRRQIVTDVIDIRDGELFLGNGTQMTFDRHEFALPGWS